MDAKLNSAVKNEKTDDEHANKPKLHDSQATASESPIVPEYCSAGQTGISTV